MGRWELPGQALLFSYKPEIVPKFKKVWMNSTMFSVARGIINTCDYFSPFDSSVFSAGSMLLG